MSSTATSDRQSPGYYYGDLAEGVRRLQQQVARINMARKMQGANVPLLDPLTLSAKYCRKWLRFYGFANKYAPVSQHFAKGVEMALRIINEVKKNAARTRKV